MSLYGLPFDGIKGIRAELVRVRAEADGLEKEVLALKREALASMGYGMPMTLRRTSNKAFVPLVWRDMRKGENRRCDVTFGGELTQIVLAALPPDKQQAMLQVEYKRVQLNYRLGVVRFQASRLERLEKEFEIWRNMMRDANRQ
jgi:hypothetical protein